MKASERPATWVRKRERLTVQVILMGQRLHCMLPIGVARGCCCGCGGGHIQSPQTCGCQQSEGYLSWQMGWSEPPGGVRGTFEPLSAAMSWVLRTPPPNGAGKPMILWPRMLCPDTFLAPQMNTRSCAAPCLLRDRIRVTFCVFMLSDLERKKRETKKRRLGYLLQKQH